MSLGTIALYMRISLEDESVGESDSIKNQRELLQSYVRSREDLHSHNLIEICDDGHSGTNFERPGIKRLLELAGQGQISCVIVKDFSRFGRNYIEVGSYLEQVFPAMGIRFISVNDRFDSGSNGTLSGGLDFAFKNLIYDLYSKDLSQKVKSARQTKMKKGEFTSPYSFFGYKKSTENKNVLEVDEQAAEVVRRIFTLICSGKTTTEVARVLNHEGIPTPMAYKQTQDCLRRWNNSKNTNLWTKDSITRIVRDERYTGIMICGKRERSVVGSNSTVKVPRSRWVVVEGTHPAIVSNEDFIKAQSLLAGFKELTKSSPKTFALAGKVKCGHCGYTMELKGTKEEFYTCATSSYSHEATCTQKRFFRQSIKDLLLLVVQKLIVLMIGQQGIASKATANHLAKSLEEKKNIAKTKGSLEAIKNAKLNLYEGYHQGKITKEEYISKRDKEDAVVGGLLQRIEALEKDIVDRKNNCPTQSQYMERIQANSFLDEVTQGIDELIKEVLVFNEGIELKFSCSDPFAGFVGK